MYVKVDIPISPPGSAKTLIPDEPTNNLDLVSLTVLNNGLIAFPEVLLLASRDHERVSTVKAKVK